jgi:hypothetical protein
MGRAPRPVFRNEIALPEVEHIYRVVMCDACPWNTAWTCQHFGCKVCPGAQKKLGVEPLKHLLREPRFKCPLNKF